MWRRNAVPLLLAVGVTTAIAEGPDPRSETSAVRATAEAPSPPLTLAEARERALRRNPELAAMYASLRAADGALRQARAIPNPEFSIDFDGFGGTIPEETEAQTLYAFEQSLEIGGKRKARSRERELARGVTEKDAEIRHLDVLAEVHRRFVRVLGFQERIRILGETVSTAEAVQRTVHNLVVAGEVSPIEELKAEGDASLARIDLGAATSGLEVARRELAAMWGDPVPDFAMAVGALDASVTVPNRRELEGRIPSLPDVARGGAEVARLEAALASEKTRRIPDLSLSAGVQQYRAFGDQSFVAGVKIPLPIFDRHAGAIAEASSRLEQGRYERSAAEVWVATALATAHERLTATSREVVAFRETVLPKTRQVLEGIEEGYRRGKFRLLDLLDARRSAAAAELRYNDALVELNLAEVDVERWAGTDGTAPHGETR